jgi:hypothetical protein
MIYLVLRRRILTTALLDTTVNGDPLVTAGYSASFDLSADESQHDTSPTPFSSPSTAGPKIHIIKDRNEPAEQHRDILADQSKRIWLQTWRKSGFFAFCQSVYQDIISCMVFFAVPLFNILKRRRRRRRNVQRTTQVFRWSMRSRLRVGGMRRRARASPTSRRQVQRTIRRSHSTQAISSRASVNPSADGIQWVALENPLQERSPAAMGESNPSIGLMDSRDVSLDIAHRRGGARFSADDAVSGGDELDPSDSGESKCGIPSVPDASPAMTREASCETPGIPFVAIRNATPIESVADPIKDEGGPRHSDKLAESPESVCEESSAPSIDVSDRDSHFRHY